MVPVKKLNDSTYGKNGKTPHELFEEFLMENRPYVAGLSGTTVSFMSLASNREIVHLTPRERQLLFFLARRKGKVQSARKLLEGVFDILGGLGDYTGKEDQKNVEKIYLQRVQV